MNLPKITLEQWAAFKAVVEEGSFARAAEALNKSQSTVSYALARLEEQLPVAVFQRDGRKAELTEAGKVLYRQACYFLEQAGELERAAQYLARGWEAEVTLGVDAATPMERLLNALKRFSDQHPQTRLRLLETTLSGTAETLLQRSADIALIGQPPPGFLGTPCCQVRMLAVASPTHPLFALGRDITESELSRHRQIVLRDTGTRRQIDVGWLCSEQRLTVTHPSTSLAAVQAGLGFAFLFEDCLHQALRDGSVKPLPLVGGAERRATLNLVLRERESAGPATQAVAEHILAEFRP